MDIKEEIDNILMRMNPDIHSGDKNIRFSKKGFYYHSIPELGIEGYRDCGDRFKKLNLNEVVKNKEVLDIGSNMGMMAIECSKVAKKVVGIDTSVGYIEISNLLKEYYSSKNIEFINEGFKEHYNRGYDYDVILALAVHDWIGMDIYRFMKDCFLMLNEGGIIIFETHLNRNKTKINLEIEKAGYDVFLLGKDDSRYIFKCVKRG